MNNYKLNEIVNKEILNPTVTKMPPIKDSSRPNSKIYSWYHQYSDLQALPLSVAPSDFTASTASRNSIVNL